MTDYVYLGNQKNGKKGISTFVYRQIAKEAIDHLLLGEWKDSFQLSATKKGPRIEAHVDKRNHVSIDIDISLIGATDAQKCCSAIQEAVYGAIDDLLETPPSKVNVSVSKIAVKKDGKKDNA